MHPGGTQPLTEPAAPPEPPSRVLTVPNALSIARLAGVPVFFWLVSRPADPHQRRVGGRSCSSRRARPTGWTARSPGR